ncbi:MAG: DUF2973 domain-containing protein [Symploca sp. SIO2B6]|nr:DUF2973 domain-containing protein [Symploca sp. SIO2B6]
MFHVLYLVVFAIVAFLAIFNLFRNMMMLGRDVRQGYGNARDAMTASSPSTIVPSVSSHPELLDESGNIVREPYLVIKSISEPQSPEPISMEDAREKLDAIYRASPGGASDDDQGEPVA